MRKGKRGNHKHKKGDIADLAPKILVRALVFKNCEALYKFLNFQKHNFLLCEMGMIFPSLRYSQDFFEARKY